MKYKIWDGVKVNGIDNKCKITGILKESHYKNMNGHEFEKEIIKYIVDDDVNRYTVDEEDITGIWEIIEQETELENSNKYKVEKEQLIKSLQEVNEKLNKLKDIFEKLNTAQKIEPSDLNKNEKSEFIKEYEEFLREENEKNK